MSNDYITNQRNQYQNTFLSISTKYALQLQINQQIVLYIYCQFLIIITLKMYGKENANPNQSYLYNNTKLAKQIRANQYIRERPLTCQKHNEQVGRYFCFDCLSYNLCAKCCIQHQNHTIKKFISVNQAKQQTKQVLLLEVESTLNRLKGRENQLKNQIQEISLIKHRLRSLSEQIITTVKQQLQQLQQKLNEKLKVEFNKYQRQLDSFYREYNYVNDYLRQNLLKIIDGQINTLTFSKKNVSKDIDAKLMPQFGKIKLVMEKCKKYLRNVKDSTKQLQNSIKFFSNEQQKNQIKFEKYDKFLRQKSYNEECNTPLLRTLNMLQSHQPDLSSLKVKLRT